MPNSLDALEINPPKERKQTQSLRDGIVQFIREVEGQMNEYPDMFREQLFRMYEQIKSTQAGTVFFLDRSARPLAWMLRGLHQGLIEAGKIPPSQALPDFRFISLSRNTQGDIGSAAVAEAQERYHLDKTKPVLVMDEFSESYVGMRSVDYAKDAMPKLFGLDPTNVHTAIYFEGFRRPPMFYNAHDLKGALYGIEDTVNNTVISKKAAPTNGIGDLRTQYRNMFTNFGKTAAQSFSPAKI